MFDVLFDYVDNPKWYDEHTLNKPLQKSMLAHVSVDIWRRYATMI